MNRTTRLKALMVTLDSSAQSTPVQVQYISVASVKYDSSSSIHVDRAAAYFRLGSRAIVTIIWWCGRLWRSVPQTMLSLQQWDVHGRISCTVHIMVAMIAPVTSLGYAVVCESLLLSIPDTRHTHRIIITPTVVVVHKEMNNVSDKRLRQLRPAVYISHSTALSCVKSFSTSCRLPTL